MKNILITGCGSGLGRKAAIALANRGYFVYSTTHTQEQADHLIIIKRETTNKCNFSFLNIYSTGYISFIILFLFLIVARVPIIVIGPTALIINNTENIGEK